MIKYLADQLDQLDLALDQLAAHDRNFDRFSLMLIDNVVELTLHQFASDTASELQWKSRLTQEADPSATVLEALGRRFDAKVRHAKASGLANPAMADSLLLLHAFRNVVYHQGKRHDGILHALAIFYFENACMLLSTYRVRCWSRNLDDKLPLRAMKYLGELSMIEPAPAFGLAWKRLLEVARSLGDTLIDDLHADMKATIESVDRDVAFLAENSFVPTSRDEAILRSQIGLVAFSEEGKKFAAEHSCGARTMGEYFDWFEKHYPWKQKKDPIPSWRIRLDSLRQETCRHSALKKYCDFMKQTEMLRERLFESALGLDREIQRQIDESLGK